MEHVKSGRAIANLGKKDMYRLLRRDPVGLGKLISDS